MPFLPEPSLRVSAPLKFQSSRKSAGTHYRQTRLWSAGDLYGVRKITVLQHPFHMRAPPGRMEYRLKASAGILLRNRYHRLAFILVCHSLHVERRLCRHDILVRMAKSDGYGLGCVLMQKGSPPRKRAENRHFSAKAVTTRPDTMKSMASGPSAVSVAGFFLRMP